MSEEKATSLFSIKTKQKLCDMWMEKAMLMMFQWRFSSSDAILFIKIMICDIKTFKKYIYNKDKG